MVAIAIVAAAGWLALYLGCAAITSDRRLRRGTRRLRQTVGTGPGPWETRPRASVTAAADDPSGPDPVLLGPLVTAADIEAVRFPGQRRESVSILAT